MQLHLQDTGKGVREMLMISYVGGGGVDQMLM